MKTVKVYLQQYPSNGNTYSLMIDYNLLLNHCNDLCKSLQCFQKAPMTLLLNESKFLHPIRKVRAFGLVIKEVGAKLHDFLPHLQSFVVAALP